MKRAFLRDDAFPCPVCGLQPRSWDYGRPTSVGLCGRCGLPVWLEPPEGAGVGEPLEPAWVALLRRFWLETGLHVGRPEYLEAPSEVAHREFAALLRFLDAHRGEWPKADPAAEVGISLIVATETPMGPRWLRVFPGEPKPEHVDEPLVFYPGEARPGSLVIVLDRGER